MIGNIVSHYRLLEKIGEEDFGQVYLAEDEKLRRKVLVKILREELAEDESRKSIFIREYHAAAAVEHPHIAAVYDIEEFEGRTFIAMEHVTGTSLQESIRAKKIDTSHALELAIQVAEALAKAHERGVVHRDLRPETIFVSEEGYAKIVDFGLLRLLKSGATGVKEGPVPTESETRTRTDARPLASISPFMSPEEVRGRPVDERSNIFSFGAIFYEMLSGTAPFERPTSADTLDSILNDSPAPLKLRPAKSGPELQHFFRRALAKDPDDRYQDIKDLAVDLRDLRDAMSRTKHVSFPWLQAVAGLLLLVCLLAGIRWYFESGKERADAERESVSVLVADFTNSTGDPVFDGALEEALGIGLEGASFITSYRRAQARQQAAQIALDTQGRLDERLAQLVCRSQGIKVAVTGTIESDGSGYRIWTRALDPVTEETVAEMSTRVDSKAEVLQAADELARRLRRELGDTEIASVQALQEETFTTSSLDAMKNYAQAQELQFLGEYEDAIAHYRKAIEEDRDFGRAYSGLALRLLSLGQREEAEELFQTALAKMDRMSDREKYRTRGAYYLMTLNQQQAIEEYTQLVEEFPADEVGNAMLAYAHFISRNMKGALERGQFVAEIYPMNVPVQVNVAWYALYAGNSEKAEESARTALELNPNFEKASVVLALSQIMQNKRDEALETYRHLSTLSSAGSSFAVAGLADLAIFEGRLRDAETLLRQGVEGDIAEGRQAGAANKSAVLALTYIALGQKDRALELADDAVEGGRQTNVLFQSARAFIQGGRPDRAMELAAVLDSRVQSDPQAYAKLMEGEVRLQAGELDEAIRLFREALDLSDTWLGRFDLGRAFVENGAYLEGKKELEICLERRGEASAAFLDDVPSFRYLPPVHYYMGRAKEGLNDPSAMEHYRTYLSIKDKGEDPLVEEARRRLAGISS